MKFYELFGFPVTCSTGQVNRIQRSSFKNRFNLRFDKSFWQWRPGIEVSVTQRLGVFKPITRYADSRTTDSILGLYGKNLTIVFSL